MPIKEEPVRIEFQYEQEDAQTSDGVCNVEYYSETIDGKEKKYLNITPHGHTTPSTFEVDFLVEVVDFLRKKGVVKDEVIEEVVPEGPIPRSGLKLPSIQTFGTNVEGYPVGIAGHVPKGVPISTFITDSDESQILAPPVVSKANASPMVISAEEGAPMPVINRPVIRTRVRENEDPMIALEESRRQRQTNTQKSIKRAEETDEVQD